MNTSETLTKLLPAFVKAKKAFKPALKDSTNPAFKSKYASLDSVLEACDEALAANDLIVIQPPETETTLVIKTRLYHSSGEWIETTLSMPTVASTPQAVGSAVTYGRRYAYMGLMGIAPADDDDGNAGSGKGEAPQQSQDNRHKIAQQAVAARQQSRKTELHITDDDLPESMREPVDTDGDWAIAIRECETEEDFNNLTPQARKAGTNVQMMLSTAAKQKGFIFDRGNMRWVPIKTA